MNLSTGTLLSEKESSNVVEGEQRALSGLQRAVDGIRELKLQLVDNLHIDAEIRIVKEIAHQFESYAFWLEQLKFWRQQT